MIVNHHQKEPRREAGALEWLVYRSKENSPEQTKLQQQRDYAQACANQRANDPSLRYGFRIACIRSDAHNRRDQREYGHAPSPTSLINQHAEQHSDHRSYNALAWKEQLMLLRIWFCKRFHAIFSIIRMMLKSIHGVLFRSNVNIITQ